MARHNTSGARRIDGNVVEKNSLFFDLALSGVGARENQQAVDYAPQPTRFGFDPAQGRHVVRRIARLLQRDFGPGTENRYGGSQLVCGIGHEPPHELDRALDRRRRLPDQQKPARGDENQRQQCNPHESGDEIRVLVLELLLIGDGNRYEVLTRGELESHRVKPQDFVARYLALHGYLSCIRHFPGCLDDPRIDLGWLDRISQSIE